MIARIEPTLHTEAVATGSGRPFLKIDHVRKVFRRAGIES